MKIIRLEAENIKRLRAVSIRPDGAMVVIGGRNGAGKTSVLDSIEMALAGGKSIPPRPVRDGSSKARVVVETEELIVTRTFTAKGTQLVVSGKDGVAVGSPQTMLDKLVGNLSFDPLEFARMEPRKQAETLRGVVGLDLSKLDQERARAFDERTLVNRDVKALDAQAAAIPVEPAPTVEVSIVELSEKVRAAMQANAANEDKRRAFRQNQQDAQQTAALVVDLRTKLKAAEQKAEMLAGAVAEQEKAVGMLKDTDITGIQLDMRGAEATNERVRRGKHRAELVSKADQARAKAEQFSERIVQIDAEKACLLAEAKFPVPGLAFSDEGVTLNGLPFEQACDSEKLKVSVAMGLALNPKLKVILCRDGSLLDAESLKMLAEMAATAGAQVWIERVSDDGAGCQVVIEDGMVAAREERADGRKT